MSRFVIVEMPPSYFKKTPFPAKPEDTKWTKLVQGLAKISKSKGEMSWTKESAHRYSELCYSIIPTGDAQKDAYRGRETEQVLKLGMALALSQGFMSLESEAIEQAHLLLKSLEAETLPRIERLTTHPRMRTTQAIMDILRVKKKIHRRGLVDLLFRGLSQGPREYDEAIGILLTTRKLIETKNPSDPQDPLFTLGPGIKEEGGDI